jgi:hypothetical protein
MKVFKIFIKGCKILIRQKFSVSHFWLDCQKFNYTIAIYIGEICRYFLSHPISKNNLNHKNRMFCEFGLKPTFWENFVERFKIR